MGSWRSIVSVVAAAIVATVVRSASAAPSARLVYERAPGAERCPDEEQLRATVAARLGYDPFHEHDARTVRARVFRMKGGGYRAELAISDGSTSRGARELTSKNSECDELFLAVTLAIGIAIDPLHADAPAAAPEATPVPPPAPPAPASAPVASPPLAAEAPVPSVAVPGASRAQLIPWAAALGSVGVVPGPSLGALLGLRVRWSLVSVGIEGRWDASRSLDGETGGAVSAEVLSAAVAPCLHEGMLLGCVTGSLGSMLGSGSGVSRPEDSHTLYSTAGLRLGIEPRLVRNLHLHVHLEGDRTLTPTRLSIHGADAWRSPGFSSSVALGLAGVL